MYNYLGIPRFFKKIIIISFCLRLTKLFIVQNITSYACFFIYFVDIGLELKKIVCLYLKMPHVQQVLLRLESIPVPKFSQRLMEMTATLKFVDTFEF